jgi:hypothetical protein
MYLLTHGAEPFLRSRQNNNNNNNNNNNYTLPQGEKDRYSRRVSESEKSWEM